MTPHDDQPAAPGLSDDEVREAIATFRADRVKSNVAKMVARVQPISDEMIALYRYAAASGPPRVTGPVSWNASGPPREPVCYLRTKDGKPDWAEDCVGTNADEVLRQIDDSDGCVYDVMPLYAAPPAASARGEERK